MTGMQMLLKQALAIGYTAFTSFTDNNSTDNTSCLGGKWCDAVQKFTRSLNSGIGDANSTATGILLYNDVYECWLN